jgi:hypothetical protein
MASPLSSPDLQRNSPNGNNGKPFSQLASSLGDSMSQPQSTFLVPADVPLPPRLANVDPDDVDDAEINDEAEDDDDCMR